MPMIEPDLSEVDKPLSPNTYKSKIVSVDYKTSKAGNPMIVVKFEIGPQHDLKKTRTRQAYLVITGDGAFNFEQLLRACHFDDVANNLKAGIKQPFDTDELLEQELNLVVESDVYNGNPSDKIVAYLKV